MPKVGLLVFPFWTPHFGWTPRLNYTVLSLCVGGAALRPK